MTAEDEKPEIDIETMRHSFAHTLAMAVLRLYPNTRLGIGPATKNGFYYEFETDHKFTDSDLTKITDEINKIISEEVPFKQIIVSKDQAINTLLQLGQVYKNELLQNVSDDQISFYKTGEDFIDLCRGPHLAHTGLLGTFELTKISEVHWLNDEKRPLLQRIEGLAFLTNEDLFKYKKQLLEIKEKDHKIQGINLELFLPHNRHNQYYIDYLPKGLKFKKIVTDSILEKLFESDYTEIETSSFSINSKAEKNTITVKTSSLENSFNIFEYRRRSYKELPIKLFESNISIGNNIHSHNGLYDVLEKNAIESIVYCESHDLSRQINDAIQINLSVYRALGIKNIKTELCIPDLSSIEVDPKEKTILNNSYQILKSALEELDIDYKITTKEQFIYYDPFITFSIKDLNDNEWEIGRIAHVYNTKFKPLFYVNSRNNRERVNIINNQIVISVERILAYLIEMYDGYFPLWLSPTQVEILSISEKYNEYVNQLFLELKKEKIRIELNTSNETMQTKIRKSQLAKIPYMLIIGEKEIKTNSVSLRNRDGQELGLIRIDEFIDKLNSEINIEKKVIV